MIIKKIKEYGQKSPRLKIDINKGDGFNPGDEVVILGKEEYDAIKDKLLDYTALKKENQLLHNQEQNLQNLIEDVTTPIYANHEKELSKKDNLIEQLQMQVNRLKEICNQFNIDIASLSAWDIIFKGKHKVLVSEFNKSIWFTAKDNQVEEVEQPAIPGDEGKK